MMGSGNMAGHHAGGLLADEKAEIVAACDLNAELLEKRKADWGIKDVYTDYHDLLKNEKVEVVDICTPPFMHAEMAIAAAEAGKHIVVEKPMCRTLEEGDAMIAAARRAGVKLMTAESYVFVTPFVRARQLIDAGEIGGPRWVRCTRGLWLRKGMTYPPRRAPVRPREPRRVSWRSKPEATGGGSFGMWFMHNVHFIAAARYLMEDARVAKISALMEQKSGPMVWETEKRSVPAYLVEFEGGGVGSFMEIGRNFDHLGFRGIVNGSEGSIMALGEGGGPAISGYKPSPLVLNKPGQSTTYKIDEGPDAVWQSEVNYYNRAHANELAHFTRCILEDTEPRYTGEDGLRDVQDALAAILSAVEGRAVNPETVPRDYIPKL